MRFPPKALVGVLLAETPALSHCMGSHAMYGALHVKMYPNDERLASAFATNRKHVLDECKIHLRMQARASRFLY